MSPAATGGPSPPEDRVWPLEEHEGQDPLVEAEGGPTETEGDRPLEIFLRVVLKDLQKP